MRSTGYKARRRSLAIAAFDGDGTNKQSSCATSAALLAVPAPAARDVERHRDHVTNLDELDIFSNLEHLRPNCNNPWGESPTQGLERASQAAEAATGPDKKQ